MTSLQDILENTFKLLNFRPLQHEIIQDILANRDLLVLLPTGSGKSLCYQLPTIYSPGVSVIISPLLSLIYDQVLGLKELGIETAFLNSQTTVTEKNKFITMLRNGTCKFLYTTPEAIIDNISLQDLLKDLHQSGKLKRFIIDEAHCVSNWGHDFRASYLKLHVLKSRYSDIPIAAFTATATPKVQMDIIKQLGLTKPKIYRQSFIRENLDYEVKVRNKNFHETVEDVADWIKLKYPFSKGGGSGIIYCLSRKKCEEVAMELTGMGIKTDYYHAQIESNRKENVQNRWIRGEIQVIVATIAFALGINKKDVRFVIHLTMPKSIEGYYQETGRAGRDGLRSQCILYYSIQDKIILESMAKKSQSIVGSIGGTPVTAVSRIQDMYDYAINVFECRKQQLSQYLGEHIDYICENSCSNCSTFQKSTFKSRSIKEPTRIILDYLLSTSSTSSTSSTAKGINKNSDYNQGLDFSEFRKFLLRDIHEFNKNEMKRIFYKLLRTEILGTRAYLTKGTRKISEVVKLGNLSLNLIEELRESNKAVTSFNLVQKIEMTTSILDFKIKKIGNPEDYIEIYLKPRKKISPQKGRKPKIQSLQHQPYPDLMHDPTVLELKKKFNL